MYTCVCVFIYVCLYIFLYLFEIYIASSSTLCIPWLQLQYENPWHAQDNLFKSQICNPKISCCHDSMKLLLPIMMGS